MEYKINDTELDASVFISFVNNIWLGDYDIDKTQSALSKTLNITAYDGKTLVGCLRILSDDYFSGLLQNCLFFHNIKGWELVVNFFNLLNIILQLCFILVQNQMQKNFMKKMAVKKVYNPMK